MTDIEKLKSFYTTHFRNDDEMNVSSGICEGCVKITVTWSQGNYELCFICKKYYCGFCQKQFFSKWLKQCDGDPFCNNCYT